MALAHVTINSLSLNVPGFARAQELNRLLARGRLRGSSFASDGVDGAVARSRTRDEVTVLLPIIVESENDSAGSAHPVGGLVALDANLDEIDTACVEASKVGTVPLVLTLEDGSTRVGDVQCTSLDPGEHLDDECSAQIAVLEIVIPAGRLT